MRSAVAVDEFSRASVLTVVGLTREARIIGGRVAIGTAGLMNALDDRPIGILSFGLCGALDPTLREGDLLIADGVVIGDQCFTTDAAWTRALRVALPGARRGYMAGGGSIVDSPAAKAALWRDTGAACVDMESHAVARVARAAGLRFAVLRAVSDRASRALPKAAKAGFKADGDPDVPAVIRALVRRPWELPTLVRVALEAEAAFRALEGAVARLPGLR